MHQFPSFAVAPDLTGNYVGFGDTAFMRRRIFHAISVSAKRPKYATFEAHHLTSVRDKNALKLC